MNRYQLGALRTCDLLALKTQILEELRVRRKLSARIKRSEVIKNAPALEFETKIEIEEFNFLNIVSVPGHKSRKPNGCAMYLPALLRQDWSFIYNGGDDSEKYYVYAHVDPRKRIFFAPSDAGGNYGGLPIYIGKGTGLRAFDLKRNQGHGIALREIIGSGNQKDSIVKILFDKLTEAKALEIEAKLIYFFGTIYDKNAKKFGFLYNLDVPKTPEFDGVMKKYEKPLSAGANPQQYHQAMIEIARKCGA